MTVTFVASAISTATAVATAVPVTYPAGISAADGLVLVVGTKPFNGVITTPAGYTALGSITNGSTASGIDTGSVLTAAYFLQAAGTETGTLTVSISGASSSWACVLQYTKNAAATWSTALASGTDTTADTTWSVAYSSSPGLTAADAVVLAGTTPTDLAATWSALTLTAAGAVCAAPTQLQNPRVSTGNDSGGNVSRSTVTSGTATGAPTWAGTISAGTNQSGAAVLVRLRELFPAGNVPGPFIVGRQARRQATTW